MPNNKEYPFGQDWFHVKQVEPDIWAIREPNQKTGILKIGLRYDIKFLLWDS